MVEDISKSYHDAKKRILSAQRMEPEELVNCYRDSLKVKDNPLSDIYENEILRRLYRLDYMQGVSSFEKKEMKEKRIPLVKLGSYKDYINSR